ncbi:MAG: ATP-binding protein [Firmicutes bacterium]|nr:ATP-binding protein [Bacillota bacterium]
MAGKAIILVGATGSGKSTIVKRLLANVHEERICVYDVNAEYGLSEPGKPLPDIQDFLDGVLPLYDRVLVFEEATVFFSNRGRSDKMVKLLVAKRHNRNTVMLCFHSIRAIPLYIYDLVNYVIVLKTNDPPELVKSKHEVLYAAYEKVRAMPPTAYPDISMEIVKILN